VITDKHWLIENLMCLLSNAVKYSPGGVTIDLYLEMLSGDALEVHRAMLSSQCMSSKLSDAPVLRVTVEDPGIGIPEATRSSLFQPFKQAQRMAGGTGLGLYSLKNRIVALGGDCGVNNRSDGKQGSRFWFTFPYRPDPDAAAAVVSTSTGATHSAAHPPSPDIPNTVACTTAACTTAAGTARSNDSGGSQPLTERSINIRDATETYRNLCSAAIEPLHILLVDDTLTILKVTSRTLKLNGHTVETAENGVESLERLKAAYGSGKFAMVLTDLQMPVMDGIEATRRYREFESEQMSKQDAALIGEDADRLIIIGMSANSDAETAAEALKAGMDGFIGKPFNYKDFEKTLIAARSEAVKVKNLSRFMKKEESRVSIGLDLSTNGHEVEREKMKMRDIFLHNSSRSSRKGGPGTPPQSLSPSTSTIIRGQHSPHTHSQKHAHAHAHTHTHVPVTTSTQALQPHPLMLDSSVSI
jgi:CheY-like chemotaxis protein